MFDGKMRIVKTWPLFRLLTASIALAAEPRPLPEFKMWIGTEDGVYFMNTDRSLSIIPIENSLPGVRIEHSGDRFYLRVAEGGRAVPSVMELNSRGEILRTIQIPRDSGGRFTVLPEDRFATVSSLTNDVYILDEGGALVRTVTGLVDEAGRPERIQFCEPTVANNKLLVLEYFQKKILSIDLDTYEVDTWRDLSDFRGNHFLNIAHHNHKTYLSTARAIYRFDADLEVKLVARIQGETICDMEFLDDFALVPVSNSGAIMAIDLRSGTSQVVKDGLNKPRSVVLLERPERSRLEVRIQDRMSGRPIVDASIRIDQGQHTADEGESSREGIFSAPLFPGDYIVLVKREGYDTAEIEVTLAGDPLTQTVSLNPTDVAKCLWKIYVYTSVDHRQQMLPDARIVIKENDRVVASGVTDERGRYTVSLPRGGHYAATITKSGYANESFELTLRSDPNTSGIGMRRAASSR